MMKSETNAKSIPRISLRKRLLFVAWLLLVTILGCEFVTRLVFVFVVGPGVLTYGWDKNSSVRSVPSVLMRQLGIVPPTPHQPVADYHKFAPNEFKVDHDKNGDRFSPRINSRGFRGPEYSLAKPHHTVRIVTLGASSTFGYHNRDDETYPYYLGQILNENHKVEYNI